MQSNYCRLAVDRNCRLVVAIAVSIIDGTVDLASFFEVYGALDKPLAAKLFKQRIDDFSGPFVGLGVLRYNSVCGAGNAENIIGGIEWSGYSFHH